VSLNEALEKRIGWFAVVIGVSALSTYLLFVQLFGLSIVRREDYIARREIDESYIRKDQVNKKCVLREELQTDYIARAELNKGYISRTEVQDEFVPKSEVQANYLARTIVLSEYVPWTEVRSSYISRAEVQDAYISKAQAQNDYLLKTEVGSNYVLKSLCQTPTAKNLAQPKDNSPDASPSLGVTGENGKTHSVEEQDVEFQLNECKLRSTTLTCGLTIVNRGADRTVIFTKTHLPPSTIFDDTGREFYASDFELGAMSGTNVHSEAPKGVPLRATIVFRNVSPDVGHITLLEIAFLVATPGQVRGTYVGKISNILVSK
jgi:hypothetical protein